MAIRPPKSRMQLAVKRFAQLASGEWELELPAYYVRLFEMTFPGIRKKMPGGFRVLNRETQIARLTGLSVKDVESVQVFIAWYERSICLSTNRNFKDAFFDELDFCLALDMIRPEPGKERTEIGEWEYQAKYKQDSDAVRKLASEMARAIRSIQYLTNEPRLLCYIPTASNHRFYLPTELIKLLLEDKSVTRLLTTNGEPLIVPSITGGKRSAKDMNVGDKFAQWQNLIAEGRIRLSRDIRGHSVILLDDLYQSGATLWSFAKFLKGQNAQSVVGLVCVKSLRDSDNRKN